MRSSSPGVPVFTGGEKEGVGGREEYVHWAAVSCLTAGDKTARGAGDFLTKGT